MHDPTESPNGAGFRLLDWTVYPSLNRLTRDSGRDRSRVQLEPKHMDVLVHLAEHAGEVVPKRQLIASTWDQEYVADAVLTRAVAELRRALGDSAQDPTYIETIPRRGYRLIAAVSPPESDARAVDTPWPMLAAAAIVGLAVGLFIARSRG